MPIDFYVTGTPAPQGSKSYKGKRKNGSAILVESSAKTLKPWRDAVQAAAEAHGGKLDPEEPVAVSIHFYLPRPAGHYRTGRNAGLLRDSAPDVPHRKPDVDKLVRATFDALTKAGTWGDDARAVQLHTGKFYADVIDPGARIQLTPWTEIEGGEK